MKLLTALLILIALSAVLPATEKPNILLLYADDLGFGDLTCYNPQSKIPTPQLDKLASQGMRFTDAHSSSGICTPSRYAMLTGRHHWRDFHDIVSHFGKSVFQPERLTLPEMLKAKDYTTAAIGKWHLGWNWDAIRKPGSSKNGIQADDFDWSKPIPDGPLAHGFDRYFGDDVINFPPYCWIENDKVLKAPDTMMDPKKWKAIKEGGWECRPGPMASGWDPYQNLPETTRRGVDFIHAQKDAAQPFFLYFAFPSPHAPIIPNAQFDGKSQAGPYGDFVVETDDSVGQLLRALEDSGQADETIVIFSADNGPERYAYARDEKFGHWSAHPLRGLKRDIYEGGHRVPTIIKWPGATKPGAVCNALVSQIDFMATLAAALAYELPDDAAEDSHNLLPLLKGEVAAVRSTHIHNTNQPYAIRHGDWLLVDGKGNRNAAWEKRHGYPDNKMKSPVELYNLKTDLAQKHNVAAAHPERVAELKALLKKIREQGHSAPRLAKP
ncbi:MAG: sulfatase family protein [Luteolibacter sp.]